MRWHAWLMTAGLLGSLTLLGSVWAAQQDEATPGEATVSQEQIEAWVRKLGHEEYRVREQAMKELEGVGAAARPQLEKARESDDPEVRWRAEALLERLSQKEGDEKSPSEGDRGGLRPVEPRWDGRDPLNRMRRDLGELDERIEEMMRRFEEDFGRLDRSGRFPEWLERFEEELGGDQPWTRRFELGPGASSSRSFSVVRNGDRLSIQIDEEGHVSAEVDENGERQTLKADSIEEFEKQHADVLDRFGVDSLASGGGRMMRLRPLPDIPGGWPFDLREPLPLTGGPRLGVRVGPVDEVLQHHLGIQGGLLIDHVDPGSMAEKLGLERWDVILSFNGKPTDDVQVLRRAIADVGEGDTIEVQIVRRGQKQRLTGTR